jgi:predicted ATPase
VQAAVEPPVRAQQELGLQLTLGPALIATKGWAAPEVKGAYTRALELCRQMGEPPQLFSALCGLGAYYVLRAELGTVREVGEQLLTLAQRAQDPALLLEAHHMLWAALDTSKDLSAARVHIEQGLALYNPQHHRSHAFRYVGDDPGVCGFSSAARVLWILGYPDQASKRRYEALALAQELRHPLSLAYALSTAAGTSQLRGEEQAAHEQTEAFMALAHEQGFSSFLAVGTILRGWALAAQGHYEEGI